MTVGGVTFDAAERYFDKIQERIEWNMERLTAKFTTVEFHRTLADYSLALRKQHLAILLLVEPRATPEIAEKYPVLKDEIKRPKSIIFETAKL